MTLKEIIKLHNAMGKDLIIDGICYYMREGKVHVKGLEDTISHIKVLEGTEVITDRAFEDHICLKTIEVPKSVYRIGGCAFHGCTSLINVKLPDTLSCIEYGVFDYCKSLVHIEIPCSIKFIDSRAFYDCTSLQQIFIPPNVVTIRDMAFYYCNSLRRVKLPKRFKYQLGNIFNIDARFELY